MAKKKEEAKKYDNPNVVGLKAAVVEQPITETLETNYMPYAMSVIVSRAIPEIDGSRRSTALSPRTANCCTRCTRWGF